MKSSFLIADVFVIAVLLSVSCNGKPSSSRKMDTQQDSVTEMLTPDDLQGSWTTFGIESRGGCDGPVSEESVADLAEVRSWSFDGDSIHIFHYPCEFLGSKIFRVANDSLFLDGDKAASAHIKFIDGIMVLTSANCETRNFFRDTLDPATVNMLVRDSVNLECLTGRMKLVTYSSIKGDSGPVKLTFPVPVPSSVNIPGIESARYVYKTKTIMLDIGGKEKLFRVTAIHWDNFGDSFATAVNNKGKAKTVITLTPAGWWTGEAFTVSYEQE